MKPVITFESQIQNIEILKSQLQNLGKQKETKGLIEYQPKAKKAAEVIRILRENGVLYQIRFDVHSN
jgi:hypothetical protein